MEAPRGALRLYNADELEPLSRAGLEALLMEIQDDYHRREGEDQLYLDATKPIRALLRKRRRVSVGPSPPATRVIEAVDVPLGEAPNSAATTNESDDVVVGTPKFGKAKDWKVTSTQKPGSFGCRRVPGAPLQGGISGAMRQSAQAGCVCEKAQSSRK